MSDAANGKQNRKQRPSAKRNEQSRITMIYFVTLYGSIVAILVGLYFVVTIFGELSLVAALGIVGIFAVLILGAMLPATFRSLRDWESESIADQGDSAGGRRTYVRILLATSLSLLTAGMAVYGYFVAALLCAFLGVAILRYVLWKAPH